MNDHNSINKYNELFSLVERSGAGLVLTRTREPSRVVEALEQYSALKAVNAQGGAGQAVNAPKLRVWDCVNGWVECNHNEPDHTKWDRDPSAKDPVTALARITEKNWDRGIFVMYYPHFALEKRHPQAIQFLKNYADEFVSTHQILVLVVPVEFDIPKELEDDVLILDFDVPAMVELEESLQDAIDAAAESKQATPPVFSRDDVRQIVSAGLGVTSREFSLSLMKTFVAQSRNFSSLDAKVVAKGIMEAKVEMVKRSQVLEVMASEDISQIGGLDILKEWIIRRAGCYSEGARNFGIAPPKGCSLIGPPGTGKSLSMKVIANLLGVPLIRFDIGRVFNKYVGESEGRVRAALDLLDSMAPCVAFIDEVDKAGFGQSQGESSGTGSRVLSAILTHMQESNAPVFWGFSANRIHGIPSELMRKGRIDEVFSVTIPNARERMEVLRIHIAKRKHDPDAVEGLELAVNESEGYVSAELEAAVHDALVEAYFDSVPLSGTLIAKQLSDMKPLSKAFAEDFAEMASWAELNAKPSSSPDVGTLRVVSQPVGRKRLRAKVEMS